MLSVFRPGWSARSCRSGASDDCLPEWPVQDLCREAAPEGVDVYFENVGGATLMSVLPQMNIGGRIAVIGMIAWFSGANMDQTIPLPAMWRTILTRRLKVQGVIVFDHGHRRPDFESEVAPLVASGALKYTESVAEGLESAPGAFIERLKGGNLGKQLVRVGATPRLSHPIDDAGARMRARRASSRQLQAAIAPNAPQ
ncbi:zinc-binding dehydrogenase [Oceaniovalibus sp. ACAM 378]|uniref:zinc-binding dehydrogenase n=1 Tax=Oceaniovalibus sp. ACAM 378 TaxID=2599923 RepID=UPI00351B8EB6